MNRQSAFIKSDYYSAIADYNICHEAAWENTLIGAAIDKSDQLGIYLSDSDIHGTGVFASKPYLTGKKICITSSDKTKTIAGRYTNHSPYPNAFMSKQKQKTYLTALTDIEEGEEITTNYRDNLALHMQRPQLLPSEYATFGLERFNLYGTDTYVYDLLFNEDHINNLTLPERIYAFEQCVSTMPQIELETKHEFIDGLYKRTAIFPDGALATGKVHTEDHFDIMLEGEMMVATPTGYKHLIAPMSFTSRAGNKKAGFCLKRTVWCIYHPTTETTVEGVEKQIFQEDAENNAYKIEELI